MRAGPTGPWAFHPDDVKVKVKVIRYNVELVGLQTNPWVLHIVKF